MKVLICYTHISPRHVCRIECLAKRIRDVVALSVAGSEEVYPWWQTYNPIRRVRQEHLFIESLNALSQRQIIQAARVFLEHEKPDVAIVGHYSSPSMRFIARWVKSRGGKTILQAVTWQGQRHRSILKELAKGCLLRRLFDGVCAAGERGYAYFRGLGFSESQLWKQVNVVDNDYFSANAAHARGNAAGLRRHLCLPDAYFLFVGALEPWKNVPFLLDCYSQYRENGGRWGLVVVGVGSQQEALRSRALRQKLPDLLLTGMKKPEEITAFYGLASCLVLPSLSETWGLVVNEAEAAGLPILASNRCGCIPELVHRGINGYVFEPTDRDELVRLMRLMSNGSLDLAAMGQSSRQVIAYYTPDRWADAMADCVRHLRPASEVPLAQRQRTTIPVKYD